MNLTYLMLNKKPGSYTLSRLAASEIPLQKDFDIAQPLLYMQHGLPASLDYSDYISIIQFPISFEPEVHLPQLKSDIARLLIENSSKAYDADGQLRQIEELLICAYDTRVWNYSVSPSCNTVKNYTPIWQDLERGEEWAALGANNFADRKKKFYKFDIKIFFQVKKRSKGANPMTMAVKNILKKYDIIEKNNYFIV